MSVPCEGNVFATAIEKTVTAEDVLDVARRVSGRPDIRVPEYHLAPYSDVKLGFLGSHRSLKIVVKNSTESQPEILHLFVKSIPYECGPQAEYIMQDNVFAKETTFFDKIFPWITENYKGGKWSPTCYLTKKDVLIMEDLRCQGFRVFNNFFDDLELLKCGLVTLARLHSCSILTQARLIHQSKNFSLNEYCPGSFKEAIFDRSIKNSRWCSAGVEAAVAVAECLGYESRKLRIAADKVYDLVKPSTAHPNVICHGDLWMNNIMFDNSSTRKCILVDFQMVRYAPIALDVLQFIYCNTTRKFRKESESDLVEVYRLALEETIRNNDTTGGAQVPTLKAIKDQMEDLRIFGAVIATLLFPVILLDSETAEQNILDPEKYEHFMFHDRTDFILTYMQKNDFYKRIVEELVTELVELSERSES